MEPTLVSLDRDAYLARFERDVPASWRSWWTRHLGLKPRAYYVRSHEGGAKPGHAKGPVVVIQAWLLASTNPVIAWYAQRLLAHEYGHHVGHHHPAWTSWAYWLDVSGYGLRITDRHGLMRLSASWRREVST